MNFNPYTIQQMIDTIKQQARDKRDYLQKAIYRIINPFVLWLIKHKVTPNIVTSIGLAGNLIAAVIILNAANITEYHSPSYWLILIAGILIILFSLFDMLDGQVARLGGMTSTFGAMYDSVLDRYCEITMFGSISYFLLMTGSETGALLAFLALMGSVMVSYVRARAEGLGIECKIGFMQRPERVVTTAVALLVTGIWGVIDGKYNDAAPNVVLTVAMAIIALFANLTAIARLCHSALKLREREKSK